MPKATEAPYTSDLEINKGRGLQSRSVSRSFTIEMQKNKSLELCSPVFPFLGPINLLSLKVTYVRCPFFCWVRQRSLSTCPPGDQRSFGK